MIVCDLLGGCGNQLFVWALGRAFEFAGQQVAYHPGRLESDTGRKFLLPDLGLKIQLTNERRGQQYYEPGLRFHPEVLNLRGDWSLCGYFQSERYWSPQVQAAIRAEVFSDMPKSEETLAVAEQISACDDRSCFIHVRRSDNLSPRGIAFHGLTSLPGNTYYPQAAAFVRERVPGVQFFVFSDDPAWCCANMTDADMTIVDCNAPSFTVGPQGELTKNCRGREVEDLWLMSLCRNAIIANSSFSWFGAWLNVTEKPIWRAYDKFRPRIVITPTPWFSSKEPDATDIVPDRWLRLPMRS